MTALTISAAARLCHCDRRTLQRAIHAGRLHLDAQQRLSREELLLAGYLIAETPQEAPRVTPHVAHQDVPQEAPLLALLERLPVAVEGVWQELRPLRAQQRQPPRDAPQAASREAPQERPQRRPRGAPQRRDVSQPTPQKPPRATPQSSPQVLGTYDPHAAAARIQELRRQGLSFTVIADQLTVAGIPTRYGLPWQHSRVRHVLNTYGRETEPSQDDQP